MIELRDKEQVLMILRRHWYVMAGPAIGAFFALTLPSVLLLLIEGWYPIFSEPAFAPVVNFFLALYIMTVLLYLFMIWNDYYLDVWIITTERLIDINQKGLFVRHISEMNMEKIQNITIEVNGIVATALRFGNLRVDTASEESFSIRSVPDPYSAKELILKISNEKHHHL